jgi:mono/diheme cytochrome c family protein
MIRIAIIAALVLAGCDKAPETANTAQPAGGGPPAALLYQTRSQAPSGDRLAQGRDGQALFSHHCGYCHLVGGMGTNLLTKQRVALKEAPEAGLLANRTDLTADYVRSVVRMGKGAMPRQTKVDITDSELNSVATYLGKADQ